MGIVGEQSQPEETVCLHVICAFDQAKSMGRVNILTPLALSSKYRSGHMGDTRVLTGCVACSGFVLQCCNGNSSMQTRMCGIAACSRDRTCGTDSMLQQPSRTADNRCHYCCMITKLGDVFIIEHVLFDHQCHRDDGHQWNRSPDHDRRGWCHHVRVCH